jgi:hypothetical protein
MLQSSSGRMAVTLKESVDAHAWDDWSFRWVSHRNVEEYLKLGWMTVMPSQMSRHDFYLVLMAWPCRCEIAEPKFVVRLEMGLGCSST